MTSLLTGLPWRRSPGGWTGLTVATCPSDDEWFAKAEARWKAVRAAR